jgi:hypothetical protein
MSLSKNEKTKLHRERQARHILQNGFPLEFPCAYYDRLDQPCIILTSYKKYAECTKRGRPCKRRFYSNSD